MKCNKQVILHCSTNTNAAWYYVAIFASNYRKVTSSRVPGFLNTRKSEH